MDRKIAAVASTGAAGVVDVAAGSMEVRLAETDAEVAAALSLRYRVFYEEMKAKPSVEMAKRRQDFDPYDEVCDHLLVIDRERGRGDDAVVGTYRLIRRPAAQARGRFYSEDEYDISTLLAQPGEILELGRSCVAADYRDRSTMQILWRGLAAYVTYYGIDLMFGCASIPGTDPDAIALPLSYLYLHHLAPPALRPRALADRYVPMDRLSAAEVDQRNALTHLPPLVKGYLRLGGFVGDGAVIDFQFNTIDVCVVVKTELVTEKYFRHYVARSEEQARSPG